MRIILYSLALSFLLGCGSPPNPPKPVVTIPSKPKKQVDPLPKAGGRDCPDDMLCVAIAIQERLKEAKKHFPDRFSLMGYDVRRMHSSESLWYWIKSQPDFKNKRFRPSLACNESFVSQGTVVTYEDPSLEIFKDHFIANVYCPGCGCWEHCKLSDTETIECVSCGENYCPEPQIKRFMEHPKMQQARAEAATFELKQ